MASSEKTEHLALSRWLGADRPKREDFNADNQAVDDAFLQVSRELSGYMEQARQLAGRLESLATELSAHSASQGVHLTGQERALWNQNAFLSGRYEGNGAYTQKITLGFRPRAGYLFCQGMPPSVTAGGSVCQVYSGLFSPTGASRGITLLSDGFQVASAPMGDPLMVMDRLNDEGQIYNYIVWQ